MHAHALNLAAVRLIRSPALAMPAGLERRCSLELVTALAKRGAGDALVCVRSLLGNHLLLPALTGAAAYTEKPEETGGDAESDADPHDLQHLVAHGGVDVVGLEGGVEDASQNTVDTGGGCGGGDREDGRCLGGLVWVLVWLQSGTHG